jgi:tetratricopeptide (TPR) repeat protein
MKLQQVMIAMMLALLGIFNAAPKLAAAEENKTDNQISYYQQLLRRNPRSANAYLGLGDALIRKARESGDPSYFSRAEDALKKTLQLAPQHAGAQRHLAYVYYSRHEFAAAALYARKAVEINSEDSDAYGVLGDALLETGRYAEAQGAYDYMIELEKSLYSYSRLAGFKSARGDSAGAIADLERAIGAGKAAKQPAESLAWAEWQLGSEHFAIGNLDQAEAYYQRSLETYPNYYRALAGLAQVRAAQKRYGEAIDLYQKAIAILPMPDYAAALGDVYEKMGQREQSRRQYELVEYIGRLNDINQVLYNRELAYFYADHNLKPKEALQLARRELDYRRDIYAYDVVAWNLFRNGDLEAARAAIDQTLKLGTKDAKLFFHAGMIYFSLGVKDQAKEFLARALAINPYFHVLFSETAAEILQKLEHEVDRAGIENEHQGG